MSQPSIETTNKVAGQGLSIRVLWTVSSYYIINRTPWGEKEAKAMLFKPLDLDATTITFDGQTCSDVVFTDETLDTEQYLQKRFQITPQSLGLEKKTIKVTKTTCKIPGFDEYIRSSDRRLLVYMHGVLFIFTPAVNY